MSPSPLGKVTEEEAKERVYMAIRGEGDHGPREEILKAILPAGMRVHPNLGRLFAFIGPYGEFLIAENGGGLAGWDAPKRFTVVQAKAYARAFLERNIKGFVHRNFTLVKEGYQDPIWREEYLEKPRRPKEVSIFENWIHLSVNVDARRVQHFDGSDIFRVRTTAPKIDEATARSTLANKHPGMKIVSLSLLEDTRDGGQTFQTVWHAILESQDPEDPRQMDTFDADTGKEVS